jgi:undecaprenyl-diphosphatase
MLKKISEFDNRVSVYWTNRHFSAKTTKFLKFYVRLGDGYIWALFIAFLIWMIGWESFLPILWQALVSLAMSLVIYECVKLSTKRSRPFAANPQIKAEVPPLDKYSFPSGHTMNNLAVASTVFYCVPQYGWIMMLLPLTWGLLRVYFGVHWLTDVLCGFALGILSFVVGHAIWIPLSAAIGI